jgi:hypothetical protein
MRYTDECCALVYLVLVGLLLGDLVRWMVVVSFGDADAW